MSQQTTEAPPAEALELAEAVSVVRDGADSALAADNTVLIHVIRPGVGRGRGRHLYEADMLEREAPKFTGWKMYVDHRSPEAKKAAGGLPRSLRDLGGRVLESWWDPNVPADPERGFGQGAVVGKVRPLKLVRELIEDDPEIVEASISATATGVRPATRDGQKVWLVEGINPRGSVDWVTEAGAGGRVAPLIESTYSNEEDVEMALLEAMTDDELLEHLRAERPHLRLAEATDPDEVFSSEPVSEPLPEYAGETGQNPPQEDEVSQVTPEALREAFQSSPEVQDFVRGLVEATLDVERESIRAEARADAQREVELTRLEAEAREIIRESALPAGWQAEMRQRFRIADGEPTPGLDVYDEVDEFGTVTRTAAQVLRESIEDEVAHQRELLAEARPTRVRGQGAGAGRKGAPSAPQSNKDTGWGKFLQESAGIDPDQAFALQGAGDES